MKKSLLVILFLLLIIPIGIEAQEKFKVGDNVPDFDLPYATKDTIVFTGIKSEDMKGSRYVLAFYPADWSPGCTREMCTFRDEFADFRDMDIEIMPVSGDYVYSHHQWAKHHNLNFKLLADHTRSFGDKMGVYIDDYGMFKRSVFVVGPDGRFEYIDYEYSLADDQDFNALRKFLKEQE